MTTQTITCDKCKKDISLLYERYHVTIENAHNTDHMYEFDFCEKCYGSFIKTVGSWMEQK